MYVGGTESQSTKLNYAKMQLCFLYMTWLSISNFPFPLLAETWILHFWVKINQVRVFITLILRVAVKFQVQRKDKDCVWYLASEPGKWPSSLSNQSALASTEASWITLVTDRHLSPTAVCRALHSLCGPWPATLSNAIATSAKLHTPHSDERLPHILGPPSVLPLALSASMWKRSRSSPLPISDCKKPDSSVRPCLSGFSCQHFSSPALATQRGVLGTLRLVVFPDPSVWRIGLPRPWITYSLTPLPLAREGARCHIQPSLLPSALPTSAMYRWNEQGPERLAHRPWPHSLSSPLIPVSSLTYSSVC